MIIVYDTRPDGHQSLSALPRLAEDDLDILQAFYKFEIDVTHGYDRAQAGQKYWALTGIELKAGPAVIQPQVWDESGQLLTGADIWLIFSWPDADALDAGFDPRYSEKGIIGRTEGDGSVGWGFGPESHIGPDGGPVMLWVTSDPTTWEDRRVGSDCIKKLGWWDDHIVPNPIFQVVRKAGSQPTPTGDAWLGVFENGQVLYHLPLVPGMPSGNTDTFNGLGYIDTDGRWIWHAEGVAGQP